MSAPVGVVGAEARGQRGLEVVHPVADDDDVRPIGEKAQLEVDQAFSGGVALDACVEHLGRSGGQSPAKHRLQLPGIGVGVLVVALGSGAPQADHTETPSGPLQRDLRAAETGAVGDQMQKDFSVALGVGVLGAGDARGDGVIEDEGNVQVGSKDVGQKGVARVVQLPLSPVPEAPSSAVPG